MSVQWTIIAVFLYSEIFAVILLLLPFVSPSGWQKLFKSRFLRSLEKQSHIYFNVFIVILVLFFIDAIREVRKYSGEMEDVKTEGHSHLDAEMQIYMKLFRAQRNCYISGFTLFLWLVLRRLVTLISSQATLMASNAAAMKQAQSATEIASKLMDEKEEKRAASGETADNEGNIVKEEYEKEIKQLQEKLKRNQEDLSHAKLDMEAMKRQAESVTKEYDHLLEEFDKVKLELERAQGVEHDKKDE